MMMQDYPTLEDIYKMLDRSTERAREQLKEAKTEEERRRLEKRIWMLQNS